MKARPKIEDYQELNLETGLHEFTFLNPPHEYIQALEQWAEEAEEILVKREDYIFKQHEENKELKQENKELDLRNAGLEIGIDNHKADKEKLEQENKELRAMVDEAIRLIVEVESVDAHADNHNFSEDLQLKLSDFLNANEDRLEQALKQNEDNKQV